MVFEVAFLAAGTTIAPMIFVDEETGTIYELCRY